MQKKTSGNFWRLEWDSDRETWLSPFRAVRLGWFWASRQDIQLLYARANGENKDYHWQCMYENERAVRFIDNALSCFLEGYLGEKQSIAHFLGISNETYHTCLARTATELLYWTANRDDAPHGFAKDIVNHGQLSDQLFSDTSISPNVTGTCPTSSYPESMTNCNGEQNLGWHSQHFPLTGLTQLLTLFAGRVLTTKNDTHWLVLWMSFYLTGEVLKPEVLHMCKISGGLQRIGHP